MKLALIGDLHFYQLGLTPHHLWSKRVLGQTNLWLRRRHVFDHRLWPMIVDRVLGLKPDAVLLPGDFTTTALPGEFEQARRALSPLEAACPGRVYAVPGNHDRYTYRATRQRRMERALPDWLPPAFPSLDPLTDNWHLLRLDSAVPRRIHSHGQLGPAQLKAAQSLLSQLSAQQGVIVLCHYPAIRPPDEPERAHHGLEDAAELTKVLSETNSRVVFVHGHVHRPWRFTVEQGAAFESINAGAPCHVSEAMPCGQGFWALTLPDDPVGELTLEHHRCTQTLSTDTAKADCADWAVSIG